MPVVLVAVALFLIGVVQAEADDGQEEEDEEDAAAAEEDSDEVNSLGRRFSRSCRCFDDFRFCG